MTSRADPPGIAPFVPSGPEDSLRSTIRRFAAEHVSPIAMEHDRAGTSPRQVYRDFWERGLADRFVPARSPSDAPYLTDGCIVAEELAYACAATASLIMLPIFLNRIALANLAEPLRAAFLDEIRQRPVITAFAASERRAGSDLLGVETSATVVEGGYVLDGRKEYSSNLGHASYVIVVARTGPASERSNDALTWFLVPTDTPGVEIGERWQTLGLRSMNLSPLTLRQVRVPTDHRLGAEGGGLGLMVRSLSQSRTGIAAIAVGIARRARDEVLAFGTKRRLYGDKLVKLQDYRFHIAEMEKDIAAARALVQVSASHYDRGLDHSKEASIAKLYAGQMVMRVTEAASIMLGSIGYTDQSVIEKLFRDARHTAIVEGTDPIHKELIFANVLRHGGY
jgi:alkylation response protein AidB-like acyl-CoA dehydrogenase